MKINAGKVVGGVMLAAGIAAIWLWPRGKAREAEPEPVRPIRSMVISGRMEFPPLQFPGVVEAGHTRDIMFEVGGRLVEFSLDNGQSVRKGDVLAKLDQRDFENEVRKAEAAAKQKRDTRIRYENAAAKGGVSKDEVERAISDEKTAEAQLAIAMKALESTVLVAPFDGIVAETYPDSGDMVARGQKILTLLSVDKVKFDITVPETAVISRRVAEVLRDRRRYVVFDSLPDKEFDVDFEEATTQADARTQTFTVTFSMPTQPEYSFLPGMSVTLVIEGGDVKGAGSTEMPIAVPTVAVGADESGAHFVWKLVKADKEGEYKTVKQVIETGATIGTNLAVKKGLSAGDRIAVAGVSILTEGRIVTLWKE